MVATKVCPRCGVERFVDDFARDKSKASGRKSLCRACDNAKSRSYYEANRDKVIARVLGSRPVPPPKICGRCRMVEVSKRKHWYCDACRQVLARRRWRNRERDRLRGSPAERGYGAEHQRLRKQWAPRVAEGNVRCARGVDCLFAVDGVAPAIHPSEPWDLGHDDFDRSRYVGPEHRQCNRATAGRKKASRW